MADIDAGTISHVYIKIGAAAVMRRPFPVQILRLGSFNWDLNLRKKFFWVVGHGNIDNRSLDGAAGHGQLLFFYVIP